VNDGMKILALGADIKSRFCVLKNNELVLSKDCGNLEDLNNFTQFKKAVLKNSSDCDIIAHDLHPAYFSSRLADSLKAKKKIAVQHHHAHIASALFNKGIRKPVIGVAFDGTGYGTDGNIWGGEFMVVDGGSFKRVAHFKYLRMPGAELVIKEPWKMAFSLVFDCIGDKIFKQKLEITDLKSNDYNNILVKMIKRGLNSPLTSSVGRLFDAVSSLVGACHYVNFEAEAAIKLEKLATQSDEKGFYKFDIKKHSNNWIIGYNKFVKSILGDIKNKVPKADIARKFHNSLANLTIQIITNLSKSYKINDVVLSGGVFQNKILFNSVVERIKENGFNLIYNPNLPVNDLSICLGQAYVAMQANPTLTCGEYSTRIRKGYPMRKHGEETCA
jgi:hydrogenase maturation protein HypF